VKGAEFAIFISFDKRSSPLEEIKPGFGVKGRTIHPERAPNIALHELFETDTGDTRNGDAGPIGTVAVRPTLVWLVKKRS
jgi:hypothetical protein